MQVKGKSALEILGTPDDLKLRSCMTLFASLDDTDSVFGKVLDQYFHGAADERTLSLIAKEA